MKKAFFISLFLLIFNGCLAQVYSQENIQNLVLMNRLLKTANLDEEISQIRMKTSYKVLMDTLDEIGQQKFQIAQNDWEHFKKSECAFETDYARNDSFQTLLYKTCLSSMNTARTTYINNILKWNYILIPVYGFQYKNVGNKGIDFALF